MKLKTALRVYDEYTLAWYYRQEELCMTYYDSIVKDLLIHRHNLKTTPTKCMWGFYKFYRIYKNLDMGLAASAISLYLLNSISFEKK